MTAGTSSTAPQHAGSRWSWLVPAGTFLAGCALGGVVVGVGAVGGDDGARPTETSAEAQQDGGQDGGQDGRTGDEEGGNDAGAAEDDGLSVQVPASCVQTAEDASALVEQVDQVVAAVADLQPERLRRAVDDVQQVRDEVQDAAQECQQEAAQGRQDTEPGDDAAATPAS